MPLYEYECSKCGHCFEKIERHTAPQKQKCPKCKGVAERLFSAPAAHFKGSGWYVTDYARKPSGADSKSEKSEKAEATESSKEGKETKESKETKVKKEPDKKEHKHK